MYETPQIREVTERIRIPNQELLQAHTIQIEFLSRGCLISVGCKKIPFESIEIAMKELNEYVKNPSESHEKWRGML